MRGFPRLAALLAVSVFLNAAAAAAATIRVNTPAAVDPDQCTITSAILAAEADAPVAGCTAGSGPDVIKIPAGTYTIYVPHEVDFAGNSTAFPYIGSTITIEGEGAGPGDTVIERHPGSLFTFRFFTIHAARFTIKNLKLTGGRITDSHGGGAILARTFETRLPLPAGQTRVIIDIQDVEFENNFGASGGAVADTGFFYGPFVDFKVTGATFKNNIATNYGGGIFVSPGSALTLRDSWFENNNGGQWGGGVATLSGVDAPFDIADTTFQGNTAVQGGGAISNTSPLLTRVTLRDNSVRDRGGALYSYGGRPIVIDSTFEHNWAHRGGAIEIVAGSVEIHGSTFVGNLATNLDGGAVYLDERTESARITNSTFSGNHAVHRGGGVYLYGGGLTLNNVTFTGNTSEYGPGLALGWWGGSTVRMSNSIAAGNQTTTGTITDIQVDPNEQLLSLGYNVIGTDLGTRGLFTGPGEQVGPEAAPLDAGLLPLADNGGPTRTHALAPASPALDAGSPTTCEATDQRRKVRPGPPSTACDAGAYEHGVYFDLQVSVTGNGSVAGLPGSAPCTGACHAELAVGTVVTLSAAPGAGHVLASWGGACADSAPACVVTMNSSQSVTATFAAAGGATTTTLTSSPNPSALDEAVALTATVTPVAGALGTPTGQVRFIDTTLPAVIGTATLDANGTAILTISTLSQGQRVIQAVYDGDEFFSGHSSAALSHRVGVLVNIAPSFSMPAFAPTVDEDAGVQLVPHFASALLAGPAYESSQSLLGFTLTPINTVGEVSFVSGPILALDGTLTYEVAPDTNGLATFRVTLQDDGGTDAGGHDTSAPQDFTIIVNSVNDRPSFSITANPPASDEDAGLQTVAGFTSGLSMGPADESAQSPAAYSIALLGSTGGLTFANGPAIDPATGAVTYRASANAYGTATFNATLQDSGNSAAPHHNASAPQMFTITVNGVNDAPVVTAPTVQSHTDQEDIVLAIAATDLEHDALSYHAAGLPAGLSIDSTTGRITGRPEPVAGEQQFSVTITVTDETGAEGRTTFTWILTHAQPPDLALTINERLAVIDAVLPTAGPLAVSLTVPERLDVSDAITPTTGPLPLALMVPEQLKVSDNISAVRENTPAGPNVRVDLVAGAVTITFAAVESSGETTATPEQVPDPPAGFERTVPPVGFEIRSTAVSHSSVEVCLAHPATVVPPRLMHFEQGRWVDRTTANQINVVCGQVPHLSPFAVFVPSAIEGRMHGQGSVDVNGDHRFEFRIAERELGEERGRLELTIKTPKHGKTKARTDRFRSTTLGAISFADDARFRPGHRQKPIADSALFAGIGTWNGAEGYSFEAQATDQGEPGRGRDSFRVTIRDASGAVVMTSEGLLTEGNIQSLRLRGR